jgi:TolB protein
MSWHKAGRAIDLLWELKDGARQVLQVAREDVGGETFWRLYLRCARQDGSQGEPLTVSLWDLSYQARVVDAPGQGGKPKGIPYGYYLDFTDLARAYGWERISSHDSEDFNWRSNFLALEYWHYQKRDGLLWYDAMREVYSEEELRDLFSWEVGRELGEDRSLMVAKGVPVPADAWGWLAFLPR